MLFFLKKGISQFLMPMPLACEFFILGWFLHHFTKWKKIGTTLKCLSLVIFLLSGYGFGRSYLYNLERLYPPFDLTPQQCEGLRGKPIIVLGQGMPEKSNLPIRYQNNPVFERRLFEGVRIAKLIPDSFLIVSMAGGAPNEHKQAFLDYYMTQLNFPTNRVTMFTTARDTSEESKIAKQVILTHTRLRKNAMIAMQQENDQTYDLVLTSSASHLPRAMKIFQKKGLSPLPSPCDYCMREPPEFKVNWPYLPFPSGSGFDIAQAALYEWLGNVYERYLVK